MDPDKNIVCLHHNLARLVRDLKESWEEFKLNDRNNLVMTFINNLFFVLLVNQ